MPITDPWVTPELKQEILRLKGFMVTEMSSMGFGEGSPTFHTELAEAMAVAVVKHLVSNPTVVTAGTPR